MTSAKHNTDVEASGLSRKVSALAHPYRLSEMFDNSLETAVAARLLNCGRLQKRLSGHVDRWLAAKFNDENLDAAEFTEAMLQPWDVLDAASLCAGAAWHGASLRRIISREDVNRVISRIGPEAYKYGVLDPSQRSSIDTWRTADSLAAAVVSDGRAFLQGWLSSLKPALAARVLLRCPPEISPDALEIASHHRSEGPSLIEAAASQLARTGGGVGNG